MWMELTLKSQCKSLHHVSENLKKKTPTKPQKFIQISHTSLTKADIWAIGHTPYYLDEVIKT